MIKLSKRSASPYQYWRTFRANTCSSQTSSGYWQSRKSNKAHVQTVQIHITCVCFAWFFVHPVRLFWHCRCLVVAVIGDRKSSPSAMLLDRLREIDPLCPVHNRWASLTELLALKSRTRPELSQTSMWTRLIDFEYDSLFPPGHACSMHFMQIFDDRGDDVTPRPISDYIRMNVSKPQTSESSNTQAANKQLIENLNSSVSEKSFVGTMNLSTSTARTLPTGTLFSAG